MQFKDSFYKTLFFLTTLFFIVFFNAGCKNRVANQNKSNYLERMGADTPGRLYSAHDNRTIILSPDATQYTLILHIPETSERFGSKNPDSMFALMNKRSNALKELDSNYYWYLIRVLNTSNFKKWSLMVGEKNDYVIIYRQASSGTSGFIQLEGERTFPGKNEVPIGAIYNLQILSGQEITLMVVDRSLQNNRGINLSLFPSDISTYTPVEKRELLLFSEIIVIALGLIMLYFFLLTQNFIYGLYLLYYSATIFSVLSQVELSPFHNIIDVPYSFYEFLHLIKYGLMMLLPFEIYKWNRNQIPLIFSMLLNLIIFTFPGVFDPGHFINYLVMSDTLVIVLFLMYSFNRERKHETNPFLKIIVSLFLFVNICFQFELTSQPFSYLLISDVLGMLLFLIYSFSRKRKHEATTLLRIFIPIFLLVNICFLLQLTPQTLFQLNHNMLTLFELSILYAGLVARFINTRRAIRTSELATAVAVRTELSATAISILEEERSRISQDLHDELGGNLALIKFKIRSITDIGEQLEPVVKMLDKTSASLRAISYQLMPPYFAETDLKMLIAEHFFQLNAKGGMQFNFYHTRITHPFSKEDEIIIYRIVMELVHNCLKHSEATEVNLKLMYDDEKLEIICADNGKGISKEVKAGIGSKSIQSRTLLLKGSAVTESSPEGTLIRIFVPYKKK